MTPAVLQGPDGKRTVAGKAISVDLTEAPSGLSAVAVDVRGASYVEIDVGPLGGSTHDITPDGSVSDWAVAVGDFS